MTNSLIQVCSCMYKLHWPKSRSPNEQVRRNRPSVVAVRGPLEPPLLPSLQAVVAHQPGYLTATEPEAAIPQFPRHPGTAIGAVLQSKGRSDMCQ